MAFLLSSSSYYFPMFYLKNGFEYSKKNDNYLCVPQKNVTFAPWLWRDEPFLLDEEIKMTE